MLFCLLSERNGTGRRREKLARFFMAKGTVKWFNNTKGYGFITPDEGSEDVFAHFSCISMEGFKTLKPGQTVTYDLEKGDKGFHAVNIVVVEKSAAAAPADQTE